jgi:hypothetical protein
MDAGPFVFGKPEPTTITKDALEKIFEQCGGRKKAEKTKKPEGETKKP